MRRDQIGKENVYHDGKEGYRVVVDIAGWYKAYAGVKSDHNVAYMAFKERKGGTIVSFRSGRLQVCTVESFARWAKGHTTHRVSQRIKAAMNERIAVNRSMSIAYNPSFGPGHRVMANIDSSESDRCFTFEWEGQTILEDIFPNRVLIELPDGRLHHCVMHPDIYEPTIDVRYTGSFAAATLVPLTHYPVVLFEFVGTLPDAVVLETAR